MMPSTSKKEDLALPQLREELQIEKGAAMGSGAPGRGHSLSLLRTQHPRLCSPKQHHGA